MAVTPQLLRDAAAGLWTGESLHDEGCMYMCNAYVTAGGDADEFHALLVEAGAIPGVSKWETIHFGPTTSEREAQHLRFMLFELLALMLESGK
jgi:hypothetical protein